MGFECGLDHMLSDLRVGGSLKNIAVKEALFDSAICHVHLADAVLDAMTPLSKVFGTVCPEHLSLPVPLVFTVLAFIDISAGPSEHAVAVLLIILVHPLILIDLPYTRGATLPLPASMLQPIAEFPCVAGPILSPGVGATSMGLAL